MINTAEKLEIIPKGGSTRTRHLLNLAISLQIRHERAGSMLDLDVAHKALDEALKSTPIDHLDRAVILNNTAVVLQRELDQPTI